MKITLSEVIEKLEMISKDGKHPKTLAMIPALKHNLATRGDVVIDLDHMCKHFGIKIN